MSAPDASAPLAAIFTCAGTTLTDEERAFFRETDPVGFILFDDNLESADQIRGLTGEMRAAVGRDDAPVLIDQEGGRVARLGPPTWREAPPARRFGELAERDLEAGIAATRINARLIAAELYDLGINVDCAPVLDLSIPGAHDVIGDRAFAGDPELVATLGRAFAEGLMAGGVLPMIKHMPGHGRAVADSHKELPAVDVSRGELNRTDFKPFQLMADMPMAMTAHILFPAIDPALPATTSPRMVRDILRGEIGFEGLLISDDVKMGALEGTNEERARAVIAAGCDLVLHCWAGVEGMAEIAQGCGRMIPAAARRLARAQGMAAAPDPVDSAALVAELAGLLAG